MFTIFTAFSYRAFSFVTIVGILVTSKPYLIASSLDKMILCTTELKFSKHRTQKVFLKKVLYKDPIPKCQDISDFQTFEMKIRGKSSSRFAKKQYLLKLPTSEKSQVLFENIPPARKWVLGAPYVDRSLIRNALVYKVGRKMEDDTQENYFAPRTKFIELYINDDYQGVYLLGDKIKRSPYKVNLPKFSASIKEPSRASFILKISSPSHDFQSTNRSKFQYVYPSFKKIKSNDKIKKSFIHQRIETLEKEILDGVKRIGQTDTLSEIYPSMDIDSFINYFLIQEIFKNVDGFRRSAYLYHLNGKIHMGPLWDFNLAAGNLNFYGMAKTKGWSHKKNYNFIKNIFWYKSLVKNPLFVKELTTRYKSFRQKGSPFHEDFLANSIDQMVHQIGESAYLDQQKWSNSYSFIEKRIFNTHKMSTHYEFQVGALKTWMMKRLHWLDHHIEKLK